MDAEEDGGSEVVNEEQFWTGEVAHQACDIPYGYILTARRPLRHH